MLGSCVPLGWQRCSDTSTARCVGWRTTQDLPLRGYPVRDRGGSSTCACACMLRITSPSGSLASSRWLLHESGCAPEQCAYRASACIALAMFVVMKGFPSAALFAPPTPGHRPGGRPPRVQDISGDANSPTGDRFFTGRASAASPPSACAIEDRSRLPHDSDSDPTQVAIAASGRVLDLWEQHFGKEGARPSSGRVGARNGETAEESCEPGCHRQ